MKNMVNCLNWNEYDGINGAVAFCKVGAYGGKLTSNEAKICGCNELRREKCTSVMIANGGFGLVPEIITAVSIGADMVERNELLGMAG